VVVPEDGVLAREARSWNLIKILLGFKLVEIENIGANTVYLQDGKAVLPFQKVYTYVKKGDNELAYKTFSGADRSSIIQK
jgi:hypothetical protein